MNAQARLLPCGTRLHLQHGPIDLIIGAHGRGATGAFRAARDRFATILEELVGELPLLRRPPGKARPAGAVARRMDDAVRPFRDHFITPMAAVAGSVADEVLAAMRASGPLERAYVNNGGDIAVFLAGGQHFVTAMQGVDGADLGRLTLKGGDGIGGIATSGRHGRSLSLGIADSVTVLAPVAAAADAAATLIANAVDLPGHPAVQRQAADSLDPDSDLGARLVVTSCAPLPATEINRALAAGLGCARALQAAGQISDASLHLQGQGAVLGTRHFTPERIAAHA